MPFVEETAPVNNCVATNSLSIACPVDLNTNVAAKGREILIFQPSIHTFEATIWNVVFSGAVPSRRGEYVCTALWGKFSVGQLGPLCVWVFQLEPSVEPGYVSPCATPSPSPVSSLRAFACSSGRALLCACVSESVSVRYAWWRYYEQRARVTSLFDF